MNSNIVGYLIFLGLIAFIIWGIYLMFSLFRGPRKLKKLISGARHYKIFTITCSHGDYSKIYVRESDSRIDFSEIVVLLSSLESHHQEIHRKIIDPSDYVNHKVTLKPGTDLDYWIYQKEKK